jgi:hypothetical protein
LASCAELAADAEASLTLALSVGTFHPPFSSFLKTVLQVVSGTRSSAPAQRKESDRSVPAGMGGKWFIISFKEVSGSFFKFRMRFEINTDDWALTEDHRLLITLPTVMPGSHSLGSGWAVGST